MQQELLFDYNHSKDKPDHDLVTIAFVFIAGLVISALAYLIVAVVVETYFSRPTPLILGVFVFIAFILFMRMDTLNHGVKRITISNQEIRWETSLGQHCSIDNNEIFKVIWQHNSLLFNQKTKLDISALPFKYIILLNATLSKLFSENIFEVQDLELTQFYQTKLKKLPGSKIEEPPISFETGRKNRSWLYIIGAIFLTLMASTLLTFITDFQGDTSMLILLSGFSLIAFGVSWILSTYRAIRISDEGIHCQKANNSQFFKWHDIEAIEIHIHNYRRALNWKILVWENDKYISISFRKPQMNAKKISELHKAIIIKARINDIPFGVDGNL